MSLRVVLFDRVVLFRACYRLFLESVVTMSLVV